MREVVFLILLLVYTIGCWVLYHKFFEVYYFDLGRGLLKELRTALIVGVILSTLTIFYWWIAAIVLVIAAISVSAKVDDSTLKGGIFIAFAVVIIIISVIGINFRASYDAKNKEACENKAIIEMMV